MIKKDVNVMLFRGSGVALITPFTKENQIHYEKLEELIHFHIHEQTDALIIGGTTGEASTLSFTEKKEMIQFCVKQNNHQIPLIAGTGGNNTEQVIKLTQTAQDLGVDGALIVTPYYNKCNQEGLYRHYEKIANACPNLPIILYNVPSRTGVDISMDTLIRLSNIPNIVGIKEASPDLHKIASLRLKLKDDFAIYSGNDDLLLPTLSLGGDGVISVLANLYPKAVHEICYQYFNHNLPKSQALFYQYFDLIHALFLDVNPILVKEAMNILGYQVGDTRLPLCSSSSKNLQILKQELQKLH